MNNRRSRLKASRDAKQIVSPIDIHVLDGATAMVDVEIACLDALVRTLARHGKVAIVSYDDTANVIRLYEQAEWLPAGHAAIADARKRRER